MNKVKKEKEVKENKVVSEKKETKKKYTATKISSCQCEHAYQDSKYRIHQRVFNMCKAVIKDVIPKYRCTACKKEIFK